MILEISGAPAISRFRLDKLLAVLRSAESRVHGISARYLHLVQLSGPLASGDEEVLRRLLAYGSRQPDEVAPTGRLVLVVPRPGTISPWSSKATDIARVCGLDRVQRIERGIAYRVDVDDAVTDTRLLGLAESLHDRMTESPLLTVEEASQLFAGHESRPLGHVPLQRDGRAALVAANSGMGLALSDDEIDYLVDAYVRLGRDPTDVEIMMFAQANSEHCRHKIFNADWIVDGAAQPKSLFAMIRNTHTHSPEGVLSAYKDNAAVLEGPVGARFMPDPASGEYHFVDEPLDILIKVETHNHPTAISPYPGAATGSGGEIRDEGATGRGGRPKAGLVGYSVSNLRIPGAGRPWEQEHGRPSRIASALAIMLEAPIGAAAFNNEFGRPNVLGYFRSFEQRLDGDPDGVIRGYHKPIMLAGGLGTLRREHVEKAEVPADACIVVLGGPAMLIGLGGGAASSLGSGVSSADLDFASVQRGNPEMQRRAQEVIDRCAALAADNPILLIHDVGAGGLSNAVPEAIAHSHRGGRIDLRAVPNDEPGMSPLEIWCNEAQERYVLAIAPAAMPLFGAICRRERCPYAVIGRTTDDPVLRVHDPLQGTDPVDMPVAVLLGKPPRMTRDVRRVARPGDRFDGSRTDVVDALWRLLRLPTVADKSFLVTIGDRTVGGLVCRDQMVGPWQVPVADAAVTLSGFRGHTGEVMAIGERAPLALLDGPASGRMAIGEAITNAAGADVRRLSDLRLSANWMAACGQPGEDAALFDTVRAVGEELCPELGIAIPVGKDSLSMRSAWQVGGRDRAVVAPVSLIISAFAPVGDVRRSLTPEMQGDEATSLLLIDLGLGRNRLGGSCLAQVYGHLGSTPPDLDEPSRLKGFFAAIRELSDAGILLAYHDRSDGGLAIAVLEMAFAGNTGVELDLGEVEIPAAPLFAEELGAVVQVSAMHDAQARSVFARHGLGDCVHHVGRPVAGRRFRVRVGGRTCIDAGLDELRAAWSETTWQLQRLRDHPDCADEEQQARLDTADPGLSWQLSFDPEDDVAAPLIATGVRPRVAVLREQGVNSQHEMAAALDLAGFSAVDVHMTDLLEGRAGLEAFDGLVACGGFSYGDVLGAGEGWAKSILFNERARDAFAQWFERPASFTLGVCNGCQMLAALKQLIPGAAAWPRFVRNRSEQFEARLSMVEICPSPSLFFAGMAGSRLPIAVSHGEGRAEFEAPGGPEAAASLAVMRFVDNRGRIAERYPANPNGSPGGLAGLTTTDGRVTIAMPHPERVFRSVQNSWRPREAGEYSGWMRLFRNARCWLG
jgi:phosphoribosylformylglycinamidine synthase